MNCGIFSNRSGATTWIHLANGTISIDLVFLWCEVRLVGYGIRSYWCLLASNFSTSVRILASLELWWLSPTSLTAWWVFLVDCMSQPPIFLLSIVRDCWGGVSEGMLVVVILVPPFRTQQVVASTFWISLVLDADVHFLFRVYLILSSFLHRMFSWYLIVPSGLECV